MCVLFAGLYLLNPVPRQSAEGMLRVPRSKKVGIRLTEKICVLERLPSVMSPSPFGPESYDMDSKGGLETDLRLKQGYVLLFGDQKLTGNQPVFPRGNGSVLTNSLFVDLLYRTQPL